MTEKDLLRLKQTVETAKNNVSMLRGQKQMLMKQLKDDWQCGNVETARKIEQKQNKDIENFDVQITTGLQELEENYGDFI
jgi:hypothetical protein